MYLDEEVIDWLGQSAKAIDDLVLRPNKFIPAEPKQPTTLQKLNDLRSKVEDVDTELFKLLEKRFKLTNAIGELKKAEGLPIENLEVEAIKLRQVPDMLKSIFKLIYQESKNQQEAL